MQVCSRSMWRSSARPVWTGLHGDGCPTFLAQKVEQSVTILQRHFLWHTILQSEEKTKNKKKHQDIKKIRWQNHEQKSFFLNRWTLKKNNGWIVQRLEGNVLNPLTRVSVARRSILTATHVGLLHAPNVGGALVTWLHDVDLIGAEHVVQGAVHLTQQEQQASVSVGQQYVYHGIQSEDKGNTFTPNSMLTLLSFFRRFFLALAGWNTKKGWASIQPLRQQLTARLSKG